MLKFNLDKILKDSNENISELSRDTGLSRKTLTQLVNNDSKGIQLNTLQKLMEHFDLPIEKFFSNHLKDVYASIIEFDTKKMTLPIKMESVNNNIRLLQILIINPDTDEVNYYGYPIIVSTLDTNNKDDNGFYAFTVLDIDTESLEKIHTLPKEIKEKIQEQYDLISKILSSLSQQETFTLFFTSLLLFPDIKKMSDKAKNSKAVPLIIDCFGVTTTEFLPYKKDGNGKESLTMEVNSQESEHTNAGITVNILVNKDLTQVLSNSNN